MSVSIDGSGSITGIDQGFNISGGLTVSGVSTTADIHVTGGVQVGTGATITGSTNIITASTNGSERLRIASNGRVAIGNATNNASPTSLFGVIADDGEAADLYIAKFQNLEATAGQSYGVDIRAGSNSTDHGFRVKNRANDTTQFLVRGDGNVGIGTDNPNYRFVVGGSNQAVMIREGTGTLAGMTNNTSQKLWFQGGNAELGLFRDSNGDYEYILGTWQSVTPIPLVFRTGNRAERMRIAYDGKVGIGSDAPAQALDVVGRISKTEYEPGEIIEQIASICDGSSHTVKSGTYTMANVTAEQAASTNDATASGSSINYTPPLGTKRIHYQYWFKWEATENSGISHFFIQVDGNDVVISRRTKASNYSRYSSNYYHHAEEWYCMSCVLECDASSTDTSEGQYAGWAANQETKDIRVRFREYSGSYEISLHGNHYWDGTTATGTNQKPIKPVLIVTAIA